MRSSVTLLVLAGVLNACGSSDNAEDLEGLEPPDQCFTLVQAECEGLVRCGTYADDFKTVGECVSRLTAADGTFPCAKVVEAKDGWKACLEKTKKASCTYFALPDYDAEPDPNAEEWCLPDAFSFE